MQYNNKIELFLFTENVTLRLPSKSGAPMSSVQHQSVAATISLPPPSSRPPSENCQNVNVTSCQDPEVSSSTRQLSSRASRKRRPQMDAFKEALKQSRGCDIDDEQMSFLDEHEKHLSIWKETYWQNSALEVCSVWTCFVIIIKCNNKNIKLITFTCQIGRRNLKWN